MKRLFLLLALWFPLAAFSQQLIYVSVTYSLGAASAAGGDTAMMTKINNAFTAINSAYTASGISITLAPLPLAAFRPPKDSAPMSVQYDYVHNNYIPWQARGLDASISVYISDTPGATGAVISGNPQPLGTRDTTIAVPYAMMDGANGVMEFAISRIINGSATGYSKRSWLLPGDPNSGGQTQYCYRSRESAPTNTSEVVPYPAYWTVNSSQATQTRATLQGDSCEVQRLIEISLGHCTTADYCHHYSLTTSGSAGTCSPVNAAGGAVTSFNMTKVAAGAGSTIVGCADNVLGYSKNGNMPNAPYLPLGDGSHDSVGSMNARASAVAAMSSSNALITSQKRTGWLDNLFAWVWR